MAQRTEWTQRDLTPKASPEVSVGSKMMSIMDRTWDDSWFVNPMSGTRICTQWSDMLIFAWVNYFCSRIRVLCVDVFRESLEWGLVQSRRSGSWEFLLGLCTHHGWLYLWFGMALSLTLSLSLLVTVVFQQQFSKGLLENPKYIFNYNPTPRKLFIVKNF